MVDEININNMVKFNTLHTDDETIWKGKVVGRITYDIARSYNHVLSYYMDIKKNNPNIGNMEELNYFLIELDNDNTNETTYRVFAEEWIVPGSLILIDTLSKREIRIFGITDTEFNDIVESIQIRGYYTETN
jgi:hypothetical protein